MIVKIICAEKDFPILGENLKSIKGKIVGKEVSSMGFSINPQTVAVCDVPKKYRKQFSQLAE